LINVAAMARTYVVTGSASGIGAATTRYLEAGGGRVVGVDRHDAQIVADLATRAARREAARVVADVTGGLVDAVVACAGMWAENDLPVRVNYFGVVELVDALQPLLAQGHAPGVVVVSSAAIDHPCDETTVTACLDGDEDAAAAAANAAPRLAYSSGKRALARWVRREAPTERWAGAGITLNGVAPGTIVTPMSATALDHPKGAARLDKAIPMPLGGHGRPEQVAALLSWLAGPDNKLVTGQVVFVDGGADAVLRPGDIWAR
jgi:NAD(P)-dependent dehydrogenase (short-subunit alcohol dehydrogenase family)